MASGPEYIRRNELVDAKLGFAPADYPHAFPLTSGQKVEIWGSFDRWAKGHAVTLTGSDYVLTTKLAVGESYEWQARVVDSAGAVVHYLPASGKNFNTGAVEKPKKKFEVIRGGARVETVHDEEHVQKLIKGTGKRLLKAIATHGEASGADALIEAGQRKKEGTLRIPEEIKADVLAILPEIIRDEKSLPSAVRAQFAKGTAPLANFDEVRDRMRAGAELYRGEVFAHLKANKDARERFKIRPTATFNPADPLGSAKLNRLFNRVCHEKDRSELSDYYASAMEGFSEASPVNPALVAGRQAILAAGLSRIEPEVVRKLAKRFSTKKPKAAELGGQVAVGLATFATPWALAALPVKWAAEVGLGVSVRDAMRAKSGDEFWELIKENQIFSRWWNTEDGMWKLIKERMKLSLRKSIPGYGALKYGADTTAEWPGGKDAKETKGDLADPEKLVRKACDDAMNEEGASSAA